MRFIEVFPMKVTLELIFERQIGLNGENGVRVGKDIPYMERVSTKHLE